jgi:hypothetical protein
MSAAKETRTAPLGLRITPSLKRALETAAADDQRPVASMVEKILTDYLKKNGYLPK